jgi:ribosome recycling factor
VNPFDKAAIDDIARAISEADLGLNPSSDGSVLRCVFPELSEDRRKDYIRLARSTAEEGRVALRNVRRSARDAMQRLEDDGEVGKDDHERTAKQLEDLTAAHVARSTRRSRSRRRSCSRSRPTARPEHPDGSAAERRAAHDAGRRAAEGA